MDSEKKSIDQNTLDMIEKAAADKVNTAFDRAEAMKPCPIGAVHDGTAAAMGAGATCRTARRSC